MKAFREKLAIILIALIGFITITVLSKSSSKKNDSKIIINVPMNVVSYTRINTEQIFKKAIFNLLFDVKNQNMFDELRIKIENSQSDSEFSDLNINPLEPIELFELGGENPALITRMKAAIPNANTNLKWNEMYFITKGEFTYVAKNKKSISIFIGSLNKDGRSLQVHTADIARYSLENNKFSEQQIQFKKDGIHILANSIKNEPITVLKPSGFHYSGAFEGKTMQKELKKIPYVEKLDLSQINRISLNYEGLKFTDNDSVPAIPKLDLLVTFQKETEAKAFIQQFIDLSDKKLSIIDNKILLGESVIYYHQESPEMIYLSTQHETAFLTKSNSKTLVLGDLNNLTLIENAGWKAAVLNILPGFSATKNFFSNFEPIRQKDLAGKEQFELKTKPNKNLYEALFTWILAF